MEKTKTEKKKEDKYKKGIKGKVKKERKGKTGKGLMKVFKRERARGKESGKRAGGGYNRV